MLDRFPIIYYKGDNSCNFMFAFLHTNPIAFCKGDYSKQKEFAPMGNKFFSFRVDLSFRRKTKMNLTEMSSHESISISPNICLIYSRLSFAYK